MAVNFETAEALVRTQLKADILAAFTSAVPTAIYDDPDFLPSTQADLPRFFIVLQNIDPVRGGYTAAIGEISMWFTYDIIHQIAWPTGTTLEYQKLHQSQTLITQLTANLVYAGNYRRDFKGVKFDDQQATEQHERYLTITTTFAVEIVSSA